MDGSNTKAAPRLWGFSPEGLHERFWASRGVAVVRRGQHTAELAQAELFLLMEGRWLASFEVSQAVRMLYWSDATAAVLRLQDAPNDSYYRERLITDERGKFVKVERAYRRKRIRQVRVALTADESLARLWLKAVNDADAWREFRRAVRPSERPIVSVRGRVFDCSSMIESEAFVKQMQSIWPDPSATIGNISKLRPSVWIERTNRADEGASLVPPVWVGVGRQLFSNSVVIGPAVLWDDPDFATIGEAIPCESITSSSLKRTGKGGWGIRHPGGKRSFDIVVALVGISLSLPLYPFLMLAIWLEDGRPFFFGHRRETRAGREFACMKFRSMRRDADQIKSALQQQNQADGPQFFIENDPRLTRVGKILRLLNLDELPQFFNVLVGDMSIVGPRPSPHRENQFSPAWREARLSVRPGVTGLWQIKRTRSAGTDFQEWIRYDLEYVDGAGLKMDLWIIWKTVEQIFRKGSYACRKAVVSRWPFRASSQTSLSDVADDGDESAGDESVMAAEVN